jgi:hypothetical protein
LTPLENGARVKFDNEFISVGRRSSKLRLHAALAGRSRSSHDKPIPIIIEAPAVLGAGPSGVQEASVIDERSSQKRPRCATDKRYDPGGDDFPDRFGRYLEQDAVGDGCNCQEQRIRLPSNAPEPTALPHNPNDTGCDTQGRVFHGEPMTANFAALYNFFGFCRSQGMEVRFNRGWIDANIRFEAGSGTRVA